MEVLKILFWIFMVLWGMAIGVWFYTIIDRRLREKSAYLYPLIVALVCNVVTLMILLRMHI